MQVGQAVAVVLDRRPHAFGHAAIGRHVEQDRAGIANKRIGPGRDYDRADETNGRIHPDPAEQAAECQPDNHEYGHGSVGKNMHDGRAQIIVPVRCVPCMHVFVLILMPMLMMMIVAAMCMMMSVFAWMLVIATA